MKIASWNVNSIKVRLPHLLDWLQSAKPDIAALQETKTVDANFPTEALAEAGYQSVCSGQKTYNGVALLARSEPRDVITDLPGLDTDQRRVLAATVGIGDQALRIVNLYVVNGKAVGDPKYEFKLRWLAAVRDFLEAELARHPRMVVLGDFNIAPDDRDIHDPLGWGEGILASPPERAALRAIQDLGFDDSLRMIEQDGGLFSWWDYRQAAFRRNLGLRIDLVLTSQALREEISAAGVDREPRTWERPSDHAPVFVDLSESA